MLQETHKQNMKRLAWKRQTYSFKAHGERGRGGGRGRKGGWRNM